MKKSLYQTSMTMNNNGKTMLVLVTILILVVGVTLSTTMPKQQVSAQNMTAGNNITSAGNMTGGETGNMTAEMNQTGSISSAGEGEPIPDIDVKLGKGKPR